MRGLIILSLLTVATPASAEDTFEATAASALRIKRVDDVIWALTAKCDAGTDTQQRQCRRLRDTRAAELKSATLLIDADQSAFTVGVWSAAKKSAPLVLTSCIRCAGIEVEGKSWFVAGTREANQPPRFQAGKQVAAILNESARQFSDAAAAKKYGEAVSAAKVQFVVRIPANPMWTDSSRQGFAFDVVAYRVYSPCDGSVVVASPKASAGEIDRKACMAGSEVDALTPAHVKESMKPVLEAAKACYGEHKQAGKAKLKLTIRGDGSVSEYAQEGDFANTPTGQCIDAAAKQAAFPRSKKAKTPITMPVSLP